MEKTRMLVREKRDLTEKAEQGWGEAERLRGAMTRRSMRLETKTVERQSLRVELGKAKEKMKTLAKYAEVQQSRRKKAETLLEKCKAEAKDVVAGLKAATVKKNEAFKKQIAGLCAERKELVKQNQELGLEKDGWQAEAERLRRELTMRERERASLVTEQKASELLKRNHAELTAKMNVLLQGRAGGGLGGAGRTSPGRTSPGRASPGRARRATPH